MKELILIIKEIIKHPKCFIWGHGEMEINYCPKCQSCFTEYSWSGFDLKLRINRLFKHKTKSPF